jgi:hypothetical protein
MTRSRAADDFATIRARFRELRREGTESAPPELDARPEGPQPLCDPDRRFKERREGAPPPWVPTIFLEDAAGR